jgi:capsular exopolysaccharide synthesis family protein
MENPLPNPAFPSPSVIQEGWAVLWRRKFAIIAGILLGIGAGALYYFLTAPQYNSTAQLLVLKKRPEGVLGLDPAASGPTEDFVATQQGVLKSPLVIQRAIKEGGLAAIETFHAERDLTEAILKKLVVTRQKDSMGAGTNILVLAFRSGVKEDCNRVLTAIIEAYQSTLQETYASSTNPVIGLLDQAREVMQRELDRKEADYKAFRQRSPIIGRGKDGLNLFAERLQNLESKRSALIVRLAEVQGQVQALEKAAAGGAKRDVLLAMANDFAPKPELEGVRQGLAAKWQEQILALTIQEQKLLEKLGPNHPEVQVVRQNLESARKYLAQPASALQEGKEPGGQTGTRSDPVETRLASLRQEAEYLVSSEEYLRKLVQREKEEAHRLSQDELQDEQMQSDIARTRQLFDTLVRRIQDAGLAKGTGGLEVRVLAEPGSEGVRRVQPSGLMAGSLAFLAGILFSGGLLVAGEMLDKRYATLKSLQRALGLPILGQAPEFGSWQRSRGALPAPLGAKDPRLVTLQQPESADAEAFRAIRSALQTALGQRRVLAVTSATNSEGATLLAANLAIVFAQAGRNVLLVDTQLQEPKLHESFGVAKAPGLAEIFQGKLEPSEAIRPQAVDRLALLTAGQARAGDRDSFSAHVWEDLLAVWREQFDVVFLATPAVLAGADATTLARQADGVLLEVAQRSSKLHLDQMLDRLESVRAALLGVVVRGGRAQEMFPAYRRGA